jgi:predicted nuclease with TOPRIM domain
MTVKELQECIDVLCRRNVELQEALEQKTARYNELHEQWEKLREENFVLRGDG